MWYWYLLIVLLVILLLWWALTRQAKYTETPTHCHIEESHEEVVHVEEPVVYAAVPVVETRVETIPAVPVTPDDLVIIEGIGPKIASVLAAAGITTFAALASTEPEKIKAILTASDPRLGRISDPTTWPEQARLAANGDTIGLQKLQDSLRGGRQN